MSVYVIPPEFTDQYADLLASMHLMRTRVFRDRLGWAVSCVNGLEIDQFDRLSPTYVLYAEHGQVHGCWRLLPTTAPYMLQTVFPELLEGRTAPVDPVIWECSRFAVDCPADGREGLFAMNRVTTALFAGLIEHGLAIGMREIVTVYDVRIARLLGRVGCRPTWQSAARKIGNTMAVAGRFDVTVEILDEVGQRAGLERSPVVAAPWLDVQEAA